VSTNDSNANANATQATRLSHTAITPAPTGAFDVVVTEGPDKGARLSIDGGQEGPLLVGKSSVCQLRLNDALVSRRHVSFEAVGRGLRVVDLGSTNGSMVGSLRVADAILSGGESVKIGDTVLSIERKKGATGVAAILPPASAFGKLLGMSREMRRLYPLFERLALKTNMAVLIEGETGTGKEALAEALHAAGPLKAGPFVVFDCSSATGASAVVDLFGEGDRPGVFERANGGTLLLDEVGDLEASLQAKLLRVLERGEVQRAGAAALKVDVRILSATRRDLDREVQEGRFREDLFHRLVVTRVELPPLRLRQGDVSLLAKHFARELGGDEAPTLPSELLDRWSDQKWPGNVRGLRNAVARELALGGLPSAEEAAVDDEEAPTPDEVEKAKAGAAGATAGSAQVPQIRIEEILGKRLSLLEARQRIVEEFDRAYLSLALTESGGNVTRAAAISGLARRNFQILRTRRGV